MIFNFKTDKSWRAIGLTRGENCISEDEMGFFTKVTCQETFQRMGGGNPEQIER